jgi:hypothetical protein
MGMIPLFRMPRQFFSFCSPGGPVAPGCRPPFGFHEDEGHAGRDSLAGYLLDLPSKAAFRGVLPLARLPASPRRRRGAGEMVPPRFLAPSRGFSRPPPAAATFPEQPFPMVLPGSFRQRPFSYVRRIRLEIHEDAAVHQRPPFSAGSIVEAGLYLAVIP